MKTLILFLIAFITSTPLINQEFYDKLKEVADFDLYPIEENPFRDITKEEAQQLNNYPVEHIEVDKNDKKLQGLPSSYDFRKKWASCVFESRDQQSCGSCWAFSSTLSFQNRYCMKYREKVILSPEWSLSCNGYCLGCDGGYIEYAWLFYYEQGICLESCYPYVSGETQIVPTCPKRCKNGSKIDKAFAADAYKYSGINAMAQEIVDHGPITGRFNVYEDFYYYQGGVYKHKTGSLLGGHAIVILGYGTTTKGVDYWICQNSWGPDWGESGYFRIAMGDCGIDEYGAAGSIS